MSLPSKQSPSLLVLAVIVFSSFGAQNLSAAQNDGAPQPEDQKIGVRIINFFKDVVYGEKPNNRYKGYGPQPQPQYRNEPERRYSLDEPPMETRPTYAPSEPEQPRPVVTPPKQKPAPSPQKSEPEAPRKEPKVEAQPKAPAPEPKVKTPPAEDKLPEEKPAEKPAPPKKEAPAPVVAENKSSPPVPPEPQKSFMGPSTTGPTSSPSESASPASSSSPQVGSKTNTPGRVKSPYPPFNELDVTGLPAGSLAMDPTTQKVFRVP